MGMMNDLGLNESMTKEQISEQLFKIRKKLITRQNSADAQKRIAAELQLDALSSLQNAIDKMPEEFPDVQIIIGTYEYAADHGNLNKELKAAIENALAGNGSAAGNIIDFLQKNGQEKLKDEWMFWAAECGNVLTYQVCGYLLTDSNPDEAIKWFEKADQADAIGAPNIYNWGLIFFRKKEYAKALEKFERASAAGQEMAPYVIADMYENGYGVTKDLRKALEQYRLAKQRGIQDAQQAITRVEAALNQQNTANINVNFQNGNNTTVNTPGTQQAGDSQNVRSVLSYKNDGKSVIPNLEDINIDNLKEKINIDNLKEKINVDEIADKIGDFANDIIGKVDAEKITELPWKKIIIEVIVLLALISFFK